MINLNIHRRRVIGAGITALALMLAMVSDIWAAGATLELGSPFVEDAILQRQMNVPVWGWAEPGEQVVVRFAGQTKKATTAAESVSFLYAQPSAELLRRDLEEGNADIRKPKIAHAVSVEFDQWPKKISEIAADLGLRAADLE